MVSFPGRDAGLSARDDRGSPGRSDPFRRSLREHDRLGGHTVSRHVGKSRSWLKRRLRRSRRIRAASSFRNYRVAQKVVHKTLRKNKRRIRRWLKNARPRARLALRYRGGKVIGYGIRRGSRRFRDLKKARVILRALNRRDFIVLTAYPN